MRLKTTIIQGGLQSPCNPRFGNVLVILVEATKQHGVKVKASLIKPVSFNMALGHI